MDELFTFIPSFHHYLQIGITSTALCKLSILLNRESIIWFVSFPDVIAFKLSFSLRNVSTSFLRTPYNPREGKYINMDQCNSRRQGYEKNG